MGTYAVKNAKASVTTLPIFVILQSVSQLLLKLYYKLANGYVVFSVFDHATDPLVALAKIAGPSLGGRSKFDSCAQHAVVEKSVELRRRVARPIN